MTLHGTFLGLRSAITFGLYVFGQEHSPMIEVKPLKLFFYNSLFELITAIGIAAVTGKFMFVTDIRTHVFMFMGVRKVGATKAAFLSILEPALSNIWDVILFQANLTMPSIIGMIMIFIAFLTMAYQPSKISK